MSLRNMGLAVSALVALAGGASPAPAVADARRPTPAEARELAELQRALASAEIRINRIPSEKHAMLAAVKRQDALAAREILTRNGVPARLIQKPPANPFVFGPVPDKPIEQLRITFRGGCCPFWIKIEFRF